MPNVRVIENCELKWCPFFDENLIFNCGFHGDISKCETRRRSMRDILDDCMECEFHSERGCQLDES